MIESTVASALRARGQRVTPQRLAVASVIGELDRHATVETLFGAVRARIPGVSLPTVYATLELLEELGLVRKVGAGGGSMVYDARTDEHHHLVCRQCGAIADLDAPVDDSGLLAAAGEHGFAADYAEVVVRGLCAGCRR
jgi:Fe2+ or Zn2+ uptake regulation protein